MKMTPSKTLVLLLPVLVLVAGPMLFGRWRASHAALQDDEFNDEWCKSTYLGKNLTEQYRSGEYKRRSIDCVVHGESVGDNPEHCVAFRHSPDGVSYGLDKTLPCCWTATIDSELPNHLRGIVSVAKNGTITIDYDATRTANVLIPLLSPYIDKIVFNVSWFPLQGYKNQSCKTECFYDDKKNLPTPNWLLSIMSELSITFAYSRRPNVNQTERPYTSVHGQCPLCRNSFPATARRQENSKQDTSVVVNTATQTIYYPPHEELFYEYENPIQGGACKLQNGLRPWIDKGVETGYYYLPFRLMRPERVSGAFPKVIEKHSGVMYGVTEGIYSRNRCPINLIFGNEYRLLVNDRPRG